MEVEVEVRRWRWRWGGGGGDGGGAGDIQVTSTVISLFQPTSHPAITPTSGHTHDLISYSYGPVAS